MNNKSTKLIFRFNLQAATSAMLVFLLTFTPIIPPSIAFADEIAWDGEAGDGAWSNPINWAGDNLPSRNSIAMFSDELPYPALIDSSIEIGGIDITSSFAGTLALTDNISLIIGPSGFRQAGGRFKGGTGNISIIGSLNITAGEFVAPSSNLQLAGNLTVLSDGKFTHNAGSVELTGSDQIIFGQITFNNLRKESLINDTLILAAGKQIIVDGKLTLLGTKAINGEETAANFLHVQSSQAGEVALLEVKSSSQNIITNFLSVTDVLNVATQDLICAKCVAAGATSGWIIPPPESALTVETKADNKSAAPNQISQLVTETVPVSTNTEVVQVSDLIELALKPNAEFSATETVLFAIKTDSNVNNTVLAPVKINETTATTEPEAAPITNEGLNNFLVIEREYNPAAKEEVLDSQPNWPGKLENITGELSERFIKLLGSDAEASVLDDLTNAFAGNQATDDLAISVLDYWGQPVTNITTSAVSDGEQILIEATPNDTSFRPGKYTIQVSGINGSAQTYSQDFTWGVLAINTPASSYEIGQEIPGYLGVLDNRGRTICDASVTASVYFLDDAQNKTATQSLAVNKSGKCGPITVTDAADYATSFIASQAGLFVMQFNATFAPDPTSTELVTRSVEQIVDVKEKTEPVTSDFVITRHAATRIYPVVDYDMQITIASKSDWRGNIIEKFPFSFAISNISHTGSFANPSGVGGPDLPVISEASETIIADTTEIAVIEEDTTTEIIPLASPLAAVSPDPSPSPTAEPTGTPAPNPTPNAEPVSEATPTPSPQPAETLSPTPEPLESAAIEPEAATSGKEPVLVADNSIVWPNIQLAAGESVTLSYTFDAPNISPQFYLLGPLTLQTSSGQDSAITWVEPRSWQIAADAAFNDAATGVWDDGATWGNTSPGVAGTDFPSSSDAVTIDSHTVSFYGREKTDDITLATGGTLASNNNIYDTGLVGFWKFDEGADNTCSGGEDACDSSGNSLHGTITNGDSNEWTTTVPTTDFKNPYALDFNGTDDFVNVADNDLLDITSAITLSAWIKAAATQNDTVAAVIVAKDSSSGVGGTRQYNLHISSATSTPWSLRFRLDGVSDVSLDGTQDLRDNAWHHVAAWYDGSNKKIYLDGVEHATEATTGSISTSAEPFRISRLSNDVLEFTGQIDDVRVYNRALLSAEIKALAFGNGGQDMTLEVGGFWSNTGGTFTEDTSTVMFKSTADETITSNADGFNNVTMNDGLMGYWKLDEGANNSCYDGQDACDSSGYAINGTFTSAPAWDSATANKASLNFTNAYSVEFDGIDDYIGVGNVTSSAKTISFWLNADDVTSREIMDMDGTDLIEISAGSAIAATSFPAATIYVNGSSASAAVTADAWHHVAITDSTGVSASTVDIAKTAGTNFFDGHIDDVRIYNRVLSANEVSSLAIGNQPATENTAASEFSLGDALDVNGNLLINSGELDADFNITTAGTWENNGGKFTPQTNTVTFDGTSGSHELQSGGQAFYKVTVNQAGGTWTLHDRLEVTDAYTQSNGTVSTSSNNYNITADDWDQTAGTFTANSSTLTLNSADAETVNFDDAVYDLQIEDTTEADLVGYWKLDEGQGSTTADSSGNGKTGTLTSGPLWSETVNSTTTYDNPYSIEFDGTNDYVDIGDTTQIAVKTISFWLNADDVTTREVINIDSTDLIDINGSSNIVATSFPAATVYVNGVAASAVSADTWTHVLITDSTGVNASNFDIGSNLASSTFDGHIDDVRLYSAVLSSTEITNLAAGKYANGDSGTATYTLNTALDVNRDLYLQSGTLDASATPYNITLARNWNNYAGTSGFNDQTGTVTLDGVGGSTQNIRGITTFYNLTKNEAADDAADENITFDSSTTYTIANTLTLNGRDDSDRINIRSSTDGTRHTLDVTGGAATVDFLDVKDSNASTNSITCDNCTDTDNNDDAESAPHWIFSGAATRRLINIITSD